MGLSNFPSPAEGVLPLLVMNTVMSVALVKSTLRSMLQLVGAVTDQESQEEYSGGGERARRVSVTRYDSLCSNRCCGDTRQPAGECCVCLCGFKGEEEVSELSCKHFFHRGCLDKWFDKYQHSTCPLCRSVW